jgi:hypothetical protein
MLYLIRSFGRCNKSALKIGFTDDVKNRINSYKYHNPLFELISTREGSLLDETRTHTYLTSFGYKLNILDEWFIDCDEVNQLFHKPFEAMNKVIWNNRDNLFTKNDLINENDVSKLYQELLLIQSPLKKLKDIDKEWKGIISKQYIKKFNLFDDNLL